MEIFLRCQAGAEICGDRHLGVKVEVSIRQGRFVGLIGHPHVFLPIMGPRAEEPAGLGSGKPGGRLSFSSPLLCSNVTLLCGFTVLRYSAFSSNVRDIDSVS